MVSTSFIASSIMALMSAASFSERKPSFLGVPVAASISTSSEEEPGVEMGVPFLIPNWACVLGRKRKVSRVDRRNMDGSVLILF